MVPEAGNDEGVPYVPGDPELRSILGEARTIAVDASRLPNRSAAQMNNGVRKNSSG